ncbi:hypothetical protein OAA62_01110 [bacterium]|nr:hypothetical protein [bacterium]
MIHKLLPFRQYDEKDVVNLFSLVLASAGTNYSNAYAGNIIDNGSNLSGTAVAISAGNVNLGGDEPMMTASEGYLGAVKNGLGQTIAQGVQYPKAANTIAPTAGASDPTFFGVTLRSTLAYDENQEKLLYYQRKLEELQAVLPLQAVPVATRGVFTLSMGTLTNGNALASATPGQGLSVAAKGQFTAANVAAGDVGLVLATGKNGGQNVALVQIAPR